MRPRSILTVHLCLLAFALSLGSALGQKKTLDHSVYDTWRTVSGAAFSRSGDWLLFRIAPAVGDGEVTVRNSQTGQELKVPCGTLPRFTYDGKYVLTTIVPKKADVDQAKKDKKAPRDMPKNALGILDLSTGKLATIENVRNYRISEKGSEWISYTVDDGSTATPTAGTGGRPGGGGPGRPGGGRPGGGAATAPPAEPTEAKPAEGQDPNKPQKKRDHAAGTELILRNLATGEEKKLADVAEYAFSEDGATLVYALSTKAGDGDGLFSMNLSTGKSAEIIKGLGRYTQLTLHKNGAIAFLSDRDDYKADSPAVKLFVSEAGKPPKEVASESSAGITKGHWLAKTGVRFSESGKRLFFNTQPKPEPEPKDAPVVPDDEKVEVDIWHWKDPQIQPQQLLQAAQERNRSFQAMVDLASGKVTQLETLDTPNVTVADRGDGAVALSSTNMPYRVESTWAPGISDVYLFDLNAGTKKKLLERFEGNASLSPKGSYVLFYDSKKLKWFCYDVKSGATTELSKDIPYAVHNELNDNPDEPGPYGTGGWIEGEKGVLIYDMYDVWLCDPTGKAKSVCVTDGAGRARTTSLRPTVLDREQIMWKPDADLLLLARNLETFASGFYKDKLGSTMTPEKLILEDKQINFSSKAENADRVLITRQTFEEYPDLCLTDLTFKDPKKITNANPQQAEYNWGKAELVEWTSLDGQKLKGMLVKPENFDPAKKYPMIVYFYERSAQNLHTHRIPSPSASSINPTMFASNGYLVFMPDIVYRDGYPGASAESAILPGVTSLIARGYVDEKHMGIQGQSWGGYQVAHLVTRTNMFAAACAGAPVVDMFSAYGGVRWGSGVLRQMQYEQGQSRIGGSIWEKPLQFIENSPLFWADRVNTPILLMNNDKDGAVPWYQGIEFYSALRRFQKPVWLVVYNGEDHNLVQTKNRKDWSIRLHQFFDHFLKGAPAPVWLEQGLPAVKKGKTMGLDLVPGTGGNGKG